MTSELEVAYLTLGLRRKLSVLRTEIERLKARDFPSDSAYQICNFFSAVLDVLTRTIGRLAQGKAERLQRINCLDTLLNDLAFELHYIERGTMLNTPWSMVQCLEDFFKSTAQVPSIVFLVRPMWRYNYAIIGDFNGQWIQRVSSEVDDQAELDKLRESFPGKIYIVSFPRLERLNVLLHCCLGHEMGHTLSSEWLSQNWNSSWLSTTNEIVSLHPQKHDLKVVAESLTFAGTMLKRGFEELIADCVGVHLLGPGALFASYELALTREMDTCPSYPHFYPPWRFRIRAMEELVRQDLDFLVDANTSNALGPKANNIIEWIGLIRTCGKATDDLTNVEKKYEAKIVYKCLSNTLPSIRDWLEKVRLPASRYSLASNIDQAVDLVSRYRRRALPAETGIWDNRRRAEFRTILNAAWLHRLTQIEPGRGDDTDVKGLEISDLLALKAIECSHVQEALQASPPQGE